MTSSVYIAKTVYGGDGLGRLGDGRVVFVPGAFAGEAVKAEIVEEKRHFVRAKLVSLEESNPERTGTGEPPLPGMVYANLSPAGEAAAKEQQLKDFFERARIAAPDPVRIVPKDEGAGPLHYRNKAVYHFAKQRGKWVIGYRLEPSHEILDVTDDLLVRPEINAKLAEVRQGVMTLLTQGPEAVRRDVAAKGNVTVRWSKRSGVKWWVGDAPKDVVLKEDTFGKVFGVPADGFYQVNPVAGEALVAAVVDEYRKGRAESPDVLDLYCGVGVFGLCCDAPKLTGIESGRQAIEFAKRNAAAQKSSGRFFAERVDRSLGRMRAGASTTVIADPPRDGLEPRVARWLANSGAGRILYVSCDPATLIRDLREITRNYEVEALKWVDMFPRTARFESFVTLRRK